MTEIGFVGIGAMGAPILGHLVGGGHPVRAYDRDADALRRAEHEGARTGGSAAEVASGAAVVFLSLPSPSAVEDALVGPDGVENSLVRGSTVIDLGTTDPDTTRRMAARMAERGARYVDSPVSGGVMRATDGTLTLMVGADPQVLEDVRLLLGRIATRVVHCGPVGSGQVAKLCNNMLCAANLAAISETFLTGVKAGLDADVLLEAIQHSSGGSWLLEAWVAPTAFAGDYRPRFRLDLMHKDVSLFADTASGLDMPTPVCAATREMLRAARVDGLGSDDMTALVRFYERFAGTELLEHSKRPGAAVEVSA